MTIATFAQVVDCNHAGGEEIPTNIKMELRTPPFGSKIKNQTIDMATELVTIGKKKAALYIFKPNILRLLSNAKVKDVNNVNGTAATI